MPRLTPIRRSDFISRLRALGWEGPLSGGKHQFMVKGAMKLPIPNPHGAEISIGKLREILNEICVGRDEWINLG